MLGVGESSEDDLQMILHEQFLHLRRMMTDGTADGGKHTHTSTHWWSHWQWWTHSLTHTQSSKACCPSRVLPDVRAQLSRISLTLKNMHPDEETGIDVITLNLDSPDSTHAAVWAQIQAVVSVQILQKSFTVHRRLVVSALEVSRSSSKCTLINKGGGFAV